MVKVMVKSQKLREIFSKISEIFSQKSSQFLVIVYYATVEESM